MVKADTKTEDPFARKPREEDTGFMSRSAMMGQKPAPGEESKEKPAEKKPTGPPMFTRSKNAPTKQTAPTDTPAGGVRPTPAEMPSSAGMGFRTNQPAVKKEETPKPA